MNHIALLVTPISELSEAEFAYVLANRAEIKALEGTPDHIAALIERSNADHARRVAAKEAAKQARKEARRRANDDAAFRSYLRTFLPA